jgi:hypothetical protein
MHHEWQATPERFVELVRQHTDGDRPLWDELVACFTASELEAEGRDAATFTTLRGHMCRIERTRSGWKLTMLLQGC